MDSVKCAMDAINSEALQSFQVSRTLVAGPVRNRWCQGLDTGVAVMLLTEIHVDNKMYIPVIIIDLML